MTTSNNPGGDETNTLPVGFTLAEFRIERVIGEGGFGIVYLALDTQLGRHVAIKEYMPASLASRKSDLSVTVTSPRHRETFDLGLRSFVKEAITLARFDHPALLKVFRFWEERGTAYMVMPYLEGQTLKQALRTRAEPPSEAWLRAMLDPVLDGLEHLHAHNILHRDIAPDNIQILPSGVPLLLDFGAARQVIGDATQALTVILKPGFAPIEQYSDSATLRQGAWTDIYALAAVCYYAISGKPPQASVARVMHDEMPSAASIGAQRYSPAFLGFIDACLRVRPQDRPQTVADARRLMTPPAAPAPPAPTPPAVDDDRTVIRPPARTQAPAPAPAPEPAPAPAPAKPPPRPEPSRRQPPAMAATAKAPATAPGRNRSVPIAIGAVAVIGVAFGAWKFWPTTALVPTAEPAAVAASPANAASATATEPVVVANSPSPPPPPAPAPAPRAPAPTTIAAAIEQVMEGRSTAVAVTSRPAQPTLTIGRDSMQFSIGSNIAGYVYVIAAGADTNQLTLLFPNALDQDSRIAADTELTLPHAAWKVKADAPPGTRSIVTVVSARPRDLQAAGWKQGRTFYAYTPGAGTAASTGGSSVLGAAVCDAGTSCDDNYGAAMFQVSHVEAPTAAERPRAPAPTSPKRPPATEPARVAKPASENARECARLLQQASMGQDTPEVARKMAALGCR
ncbi:MAG: serine/threonine-protein kinase [Burkholderiales bacterium]